MTTGVCFSLQPGHYRLTSDFVGTKLDRRLSGSGLHTKAGFAAGTRFTIKQEYDTEVGFVIEAPFIEYIQQSRVFGHRAPGSTDIFWFPDNTSDFLRLMNALVPDTSSSTWLAHAVGRSSSAMSGFAEEILLELLDSGRVSKDEIDAIYQKTMLRYDLEDAAQKARKAER